VSARLVLIAGPGAARAAESAMAAVSRHALGAVSAPWPPRPGPLAALVRLPGTVVLHCEDHGAATTFYARSDAAGARASLCLARGSVGEDWREVGRRRGAGRCRPRSPLAPVLLEALSAWAAREHAAFWFASCALRAFNVRAGARRGVRAAGVRAAVRRAVRGVAP
jgi:hypothetical protein